jgi:hypothetical protein
MFLEGCKPFGRHKKGYDNPIDKLMYICKEEPSGDDGNGETPVDEEFYRKAEEARNAAQDRARDDYEKGKAREEESRENYRKDVENDRVPEKGNRD